jgi:hypothetical protein
MFARMKIRIISTTTPPMIHPKTFQVIAEE